MHKSESERYYNMGFQERKNMYKIRVYLYHYPDTLRFDS